MSGAGWIALGAVLGLLLAGVAFGFGCSIARAIDEWRCRGAKDLWTMPGGFPPYDPFVHAGEAGADLPPASASPGSGA